MDGIYRLLNRFGNLGKKSKPIIPKVIFFWFCFFAMLVSNAIMLLRKASLLSKSLKDDWLVLYYPGNFTKIKAAL